LPEVENNYDNLRKWFRGCPALSADNRFRIDFLSEDPTEYALYAVPTVIKYRENVLGEAIPQRIQELNFIFASKEQYGADVQQNLANLGFYDEVVNWVIEQNAERNFPTINEGTVISIIPTLTQYVAEVGSDSAKYQIQLKLTYKRK